MKKKLIKSRFFKILIYSLIILLLVPASYPAHAETISSNLSAEFKKVGESDNLMLYYNEKEMSIAVKNKKSGYIWTSAVDDKKIDPKKVNSAFLNNIKSLFILNYTDLAKDVDTSITAGNYKLKPQIKTENIKNGVRVQFKFLDLKLSIVMEMFLEGDSLKVKIPLDGVQEMVGTDEDLSKRLKDINESLKGIRQIFDKHKEIKELKEGKNKDIIVKAERELENIESEIKSISNIYGLNSEAEKTYSFIQAFKDLVNGTKDKRGAVEVLKESEQTEAVKLALKEYQDMVKAIDSLMNVVGQLKKVTTAGVTQIDILPYFGASADGEEGYAFYPDGCGAITNFKKESTAQNQYYRKDIYSDSNIDMDNYELYKKNGMQEIMMPVFGMKAGDNAFMGVVTGAEADSSIMFYPSGYQINLNRTNASFIYRRPYQPITKNWWGFTFKMIEKEKIAGTREVTYMFLTGDEANYSGMANSYRKYLLDKEQITKSKEIGDSVPLGLDILMGIKEKRALMDKLIPMTTFKQAKEMVDNLNKDGIKNMQVNLLGWSKSGFKSYPSSLSAAGSLGGKRELKNLIKDIKDKNYKIFLQDNIIDAQKENGGFSVGKDVARAKSDKQITDRFKNKYLFSPVYVLQNFVKKITPNVKSLGVNGVAFDKLGYFIYSDYTQKSPSPRQQTVDYWSKVLCQSETELGGAMSCGGNQYVLKHVDRLSDIPVKSTGYFITDESVPFYQMVVHGLIPYSSKPFNLFYDRQLEKLKAIEYGCMPYYQLTYKDSEELKYTDYNQLFTSKYEDWKEDIGKTYKEFNDKLSQLNDKYIVKHEKLQENVYKIAYSNGTNIYINYTEQPIQVDGHTIKDMDYIVVQKGGSVK